MNSEQVLQGIQRAPHRSLFNALGWTEELGEELAAKVRALTPGQRELIGQLIYEGWTQEAVARMRGVDRRSVGRMWRRAVERLR